MRIVNSEQFQADAITPEPEMRHGVDDPQVDFAADPLNSMTVPTLYIYTTPGSVSMWLKIAGNGGAGDWQLIN